MAHPIIFRKCPQPNTSRDSRGNDRKVVNEALPSPLHQRDRFIHQKVPSLDHAASFPAKPPTCQCVSGWVAALRGTRAPFEYGAIHSARDLGPQWRMT